MALRFEPERRIFHFRTPARTSRGALTARALWLLHLYDDARPAALAGLGEAGPIAGLSADANHEGGPGFDEIVQEYVAVFNRQPPELAALTLAELPNAPSLRFGVETALIGAAAEGPGLLWRSAFTCEGAPLPTHGLIWMADEQGILDQVRAKVRAGFEVIKMKIGALEAGREQRLLRAIVAEHPQITLRLDANGVFTPEAALEYLRGIADLPVEFVEQPIAPGQRAALAALCAESPLPLALDEELIGIDTPAERRALLDAVRPAHLILKPALLGGFAACDDWIAACTERGVQWWANSLLECAVGHNAVCQWTAARAPERVHGLGTGSLFADNLPSPIRLEGAALSFAK